MVTLEDYVLEQEKFLDAEWKAEEAVNAEYLMSLSKNELYKRGLAVNGLLVDSIKTFMGGRLAVTFVKEGLASACMKAGDLCKVEGGDVDITGTIHRIEKNTLQVIVDGEFVDDGQMFRIVKSSNKIVYERMLVALKELDVKNPIVSLFMDCLNTASSLNIRDVCGSSYTQDSELNESQEKAVAHAVNLNNPLTLIHGPPGTGKTSTICAIIAAILSPAYKLSLKGRELKLLVCGPSNLSVDNIVERLRSKRVIRIGHPARLSDSVVNSSLDYLLDNAEGSELIRDIKREIDSQLKLLPNTKKKRDVYLELKVLRNELKSREKLLQAQLLKERTVVACTLGMAGSNKVVKNGPYDVVICDEASQALQAESWIALAQCSKKAVIVGDHCQLPPTVISKQVHLEKTVFDVFRGRYNACLLDVQYRMHEDIMGWSNQRFYHSKLKADESVKAQVLEGFNPVVFVDTSGLQYWDSSSDANSSRSESFYNEQEGQIILKHYHLLRSMHKTCSIAVITPYSAQVDLLSRLLPDSDINLQIGTVDGFQGREASCVLISLVRSNPDNTIGFVKDPRRVNVAVTRAKRRVVVVGDGEAVGKGGYGDWVDYLWERGEVEICEA